MTPIPHNRPSLDESDVDAVAAVLRSGHVAHGPEVRAFEEEMAARVGQPGWDAVAVSSGTAALYLALKALRIRPGAGVLQPTYACTALVHATRLAGAEPRLTDVRDSDFNLDPDAVQAGPELGAAILPHTYGVPADPGPLARLGVPVVEDGAQALGARLGGRAIGGLGALSVFSFYATKPLTSGHGGMVVGPRAACDEIRDRRDYDGKRELTERFNFHMSDVQAALGRSQLRRLDAFLRRRAETAALYAGALPPSLGRQSAPAGAEPNHFRFVLRVRQVEEARRRLAAAGITAIVPTEPWELLHRQLGLPEAGFPAAETVARTTLSVPIHPALTDEERGRVASALARLADLD